MSDDPKKPSEEQQTKAEAEAHNVSSGETSMNETLAAATDNGSSFEEELPDIEPLTPELVEEEAIRGDFMLRWAAIFLALLFGFSKMTDTRTLVHVRSGEQMRANGFLPSTTDTLSFTAEGKPAANVSWLFDHVLSGIWTVGGDTGLSIFKAMIAAITAWVLSRISVAGMPTWWSSICAVFAIVACSGDFAATTELITLLGMVLLLGLLHKHREGKATGLSWKLPLLIAIWCNLDSHAWIGALSAALYAVGMLLAGRKGAHQEADEGQPVPDAIQAGQGLGLAAALAVAALLVNPFPLNSLLSPMATYSVEYPTMQKQRPLESSLAGLSFDGRIDYFSMLDPNAFTLFDHTQIAGICIVMLAIAGLLLSRTAADRGFLCLMVGLIALAIYRTHELPVASLAGAVIVSTIAQRWYRRSFNLQYSIDPKELLFSRGGRAVTVFAFAFLGFCVVAGRLPGNTPVGPGFEKDIQTTIETLGTQLAAIPTDAHILHTRIDQGDILIWHGRKSMIDSRVIPFGRMDNKESIVARHAVMLRTLLLPQATAVEEEEKKEQQENQVAAATYLDEFAITHVMPRLAPPGAPDYRSIQMLAGKPDWLLVDLGPSAAFLERVSPTLPDEERNKKLPAFGVKAFQKAEAVPTVRVDFAREPDFYQKYVYRERPSQDEHLRQAEHYLWLASGSMQSAEQVVASLSLAVLAIREANQSLYTDPQNSLAYRLLGMGYRQLDIVEGILSGQQGDSTRAELRYLQAVMALRQALKSNPNDAVLWELLYQLYSGRQKQDLAGECLDHWLPLQEAFVGDIKLEAVIKDMFDMNRQLKENARDSQARLDEFLEANPYPEDPVEKANRVLGIASELAQSGFSLQALKLLQEHTDLVRQNPIGQALLGALLLESGAIEEGFRLLNQLAMVAREQPASFAGIRWHFPAAVSQLSLADYVSAVDYLSQQLKDVEQAAATPEPYRNILLSAPLASEYAMLPQAMLPQWPIGHLNSIAMPVTGITRAQSDVRFLIAMCHVEDGNVQKARLVLQALISEGGESPYRQLAAYYLSLIDDNGAKFIDEHTLDNWEDFEFVADAGAATKAASQPTSDTSASNEAPEAKTAK